ncbi:30S ribosomal protein S5 [Candidatus Nomurabacteria bacterium]|nr:30S ribosomal protein S5 [Candidatus Nomurabacteria bacterium]
MERRNQRDNQEEKLFDERVLNVDRVARVVKGGRRFRFRALVVVGDKKGKIGIGIAKGADVTSAVSKAVDTAKKNMVEIVQDNGTIPHEVQEKVGGANVLIKPASAGTGLIAGGVVRTLLEVAGISNALSKNLGSSNKVNTAYATLKALESLTPKSEWVVKPVKVKKETTQTVSKDAKKAETKVKKESTKEESAKKVAPKKPATKKAEAAKGLK